MALVIFFAGCLADKRELLAATNRSFLGFHIPRIRYLGPVVLVWVASIGLLVLEKDVGIGLLFIVISPSMLYEATGSNTYVLFGSMLFLAGLPALYLIFSHVQKRMQSWLYAWPDHMGTGTR